MLKRWFIVKFYSSNQCWIEMPRCESATVAAEIVCVILKAFQLTGEAIKVEVINVVTDD